MQPGMIRATLTVTGILAMTPWPATAQDRHTATLLFMVDLHGQIQSHPELFWSNGERTLTEAGGVARLAAAAKAIKQKYPNRVICIDAGDTIQGSAIAAWTKGKAVVDPMNGIGLDVALPGNWSVVYGPEVLRKRAEQFSYRLIASNVYDEATNKRLFPPYHVATVGGVKIGVTGFTDPDIPTRQPPSFSKGLKYVGSKTLQPLIDELRNKKKVDVVVLVTHIGLSKAVRLVEQLDGLDIMLSGDTHERTYEPIVRGQCWIVEPGAFGSFLGRLDVTVEKGRLVNRQWELIELRADRVTPDSGVRQDVQENVEPYRDRLGEVLGHTQEPLLRYDVVETNLDKILSDALREAAGTEIAISNGFRFAHPIMPGPITLEHLHDWYPVNEPLKTGKVTGRQLHDFWESELHHVFARNAEELFDGWVPRPSGMTVRFVAGREKGNRVREIRVNGKPLEMDRVYTLTACRREGSPKDSLCRIPNVKEPKVLDIDAHGAVRRYLKAHDPMKVPQERRVVAEDLPESVLSQYQAIQKVHARGPGGSGQHAEAK